MVARAYIRLEAAVTQFVHVFTIVHYTDSGPNISVWSSIQNLTIILECLTKC